MAFYLILGIHFLLCLGLVGLVLLQQGRGADAGVTFGAGSGNSVFGVSGATDFITKLTTGLAISFMVTSVLLVKSYQDRTPSSLQVVSDPLEGSVVAPGLQQSGLETQSEAGALPAPQAVVPEEGVSVDAVPEMGGPADVTDQALPESAVSGVGTPE